MKILDTEEQCKPRTDFAAMATYDITLGERVLTKLELFSKDKNIQLDKKECKALLEALNGEGWLLRKYLNREEYQPYSVMSGSLDGSSSKDELSIFDSDRTTEIL
jgi:hypothetical protein